jgi:transposase
MTRLGADLGLTPELLGLTDIKIESISLSRDNTFHIKVSSIKEQTSCRKCGNPTDAYGYGRTLRLRHLPILGHEVYIEITPPRGICKQCDDQPTTTQTLDWFERNGHHTRPYDDYLMLQLMGSTLSDVAKKENLTEEILQGVIDLYQIDEVHWISIQRIGLLGLDEIAIKKGYSDYVTLITSRYQGINKILGVIKGKEKASIKAFLSTIPNNKRKTITAVCVDLCDNYINAVKEVLDKDIPIVADRFHVSKLYRQEITKLRSNELKRLRKSLSDQEYKALRPAIKILISKQECYTTQDKKILNPLFKLSPAIKAAYKLARELTHIYNRHQRKSTAQVQIKKWINKAEASDAKCLNKFINALKKYEEPISNYFINRDTSGWIEGINNKVKLIKRRCYGITVLKHFFQRIFLDLQGYDIFINKQLVSYPELQHKIR